MSKQDAKDKFIELRIKGETFESIAKKLNVSKQTVINWSKEKNIQEAIETAELMKIQSILKTYQLNREAKIKYYCELNDKIKNELSKRDFSKLAVDKLFKILISNESKISYLIPSKQFFENELDISSSFTKTFVFNPQD